MITIKTNQSRGMRNCNPLNLRHSKDKWVGMSAVQTDKSFVQFVNTAYGYRAALKTLDSYYRKHKLRSVTSIITRWAPPSENPTKAYVEHILRSVMRYDIEDRLPYITAHPDLWKAILRAMTAMECSPREAYLRTTYQAIDEGFEMFRKQLRLTEEERREF